jgi:hypothetical protein
MTPATNAFFELNGRALQMPLCESPFFDDIVAAGPYSETERALLRAFRSDGYVVFDLQLPDFAGFATELISEVAAMAVAPDGSQPVRVQEAWASCPTVGKLACLPQILDTIQLLYGARPFPFQTLNFRVGSEQMTHSDSIHFSSIPARMMCGVWVALEDVDAGNGPLHYYPGSQKLPIYTFEDMGISTSDKPPGYELYGRVYEPFIQKLIAASGLEKERLFIKRGQALIWAANLLHGGEPIEDPSRTRQSQVTHYYFEDCLYYTPMWSDLGLRSIHYRLPYNLLNRAKQPPRFDGHTVQVPDETTRKPSTLAKTTIFAKRALRKVHRELRSLVRR